MNELHERGIDYATYINASITSEERKSRLNGIISGRYSVVYLSPEFLLGGDIRTLTGGRDIGLVVIDEAHLVTSWGRDFRADYWFLGDYIENVRRESPRSDSKPQKFPVLCLTATAVYGGRDDVVGDLQQSLHLACYTGHIYIGYVRRGNIKFDIRHHEKKSRSKKEAKTTLAVAAAVKYVREKQKTIMYFPFVRQIGMINEVLQKFEEGAKTETYYGGMNGTDKDTAYENFRCSRSTVMLATKAFGMGVNIGDIRNVYHFSPTGTLADYVQEIGRAARNLKEGCAVADYMISDMQYVQMLWGLSGLKHYQLKEMAKKLYDICTHSEGRNILFSPETFSYLFSDYQLENSVKSGLLMLSADLNAKSHFRLLSVRPRSLFSVQYILVPHEIEMKFLDEYGSYCKKVNDCYPRKSAGGSIIKNGKVFEIDLAKLWENKFIGLSFQQFKFKFLSGELFPETDKGQGECYRIVPNMKMTITYEKGWHKVSVLFKKVSEAIQDSFNDLFRNFGRKHFSFSDFYGIFSKRYRLEGRREYIRMVLDLFCYDHVDFSFGASYRQPTESWKFIERIKPDTDSGNFEEKYCIRGDKYAGIGSKLRSYFSMAEPNSKYRVTEKYTVYLPMPQPMPARPKSYESQCDTSSPPQQLMASILQLFGLASYEITGGRNLQISITVTDPSKLLDIAASTSYRNAVLSDIEAKHKRAVKIMQNFMSKNFTDKERWEIIEEYFLGHDSNVDTLLGINQQEGE